jgi:hypothetical protein
MSLETLRDLVIVVYGIMGILLFLVLIAVAVVLLLGVRRLMRVSQDVIEDPIRPALADLRESASSVRAASEFWADNAVSPLVKVMAAGRGVKRGVSSFSRVAKRVRR